MAIFRFMENVGIVAIDGEISVMEMSWGKNIGQNVIGEMVLYLFFFSISCLIYFSFRFWLRILSYALNFSWIELLVSRLE